jgi:hypothetical protein
MHVQPVQVQPTGQSEAAVYSGARTCMVMMGLGRMCSAGGRQAVPLPRPLRWLMRSWKSRLSWLKRCRAHEHGHWDQARGDDTPLQPR